MVFIQNVRCIESQAQEAASGSLSWTAPPGASNVHRSSEIQDESRGERHGALRQRGGGAHGHSPPAPQDPPFLEKAQVDQAAATWQWWVSRPLSGKAACPSARTPPYNPAFPPIPTTSSDPKDLGEAPGTEILSTWININMYKNLVASPWDRKPTLSCFSYTWLCWGQARFLFQVYFSRTASLGTSPAPAWVTLGPFCTPMRPHEEHSFKDLTCLRLGLKRNILFPGANAENR